MSTASRPFTKLPAPVKRLVYFALCITAFLGVSAALRPEGSLAAAREDYELRQARVVAATDAAKLPGAAPLQAPEIESKLPLLGTLVGSPHFVWVYAGPKGPLYTVADRSGRILAREVDVETLYQECPEVSVRTLQLQPGVPGPLMMVEPSREP